jgi:phenylacetate-CoA ligase
MLIIRGVNVYPSQVEEVLARMTGLSPHYRIVVSREQHLDEITVHAEVDAGWDTSTGWDEGDAAREMVARLAHLLRDTIGVGMTVQLLAPGQAPRSEGGKLSRVVDQRPR